MIKTGIIGAASPIAGELLRILVNHPEVDSVTAFQPELARRSVTTVHHGLIGEHDIEFTDKINPSSLDVVFFCGSEEITDFIVDHLADYPQLRIIDFSGKYKESPEGERFIYGLPEVYRKPLVRGAKYATIPQSAEVGTIVGLFPLAIAGVLPTEDIEVILSGSKPDRNMTHDSGLKVESVMSEFQEGFINKVTFKVIGSDSGKVMKTSCTLPLSADIEDINSMYDKVYDDHNFTFFVNRPLDLDEVEGTNKCLISLTKPEDSQLRIDTILDTSLRGDAGEAIHVMNLLFGLHERVGLSFKASNAYVRE